MAGKTKLDSDLSDKICVVIAAYNESGTIGKVISDVRDFCSKTVVIDDCSSDNTGEIASRSGAVVLKHVINLGQGAALETGFEYVRRNLPGKIAVTFDADDQFLASDILAVSKPLIANGADIALGSRFLGSTQNMPFLRKLILKSGILVTWVLSGIKLTDTHNGLRAISPLALEKIKITQNRMAHASDIIDQIVLLNLKYVEVPVHVTYHKHRKGQTNLGSLHILKDILFEKLSP